MRTLLGLILVGIGLLGANAAMADDGAMVPCAPSTRGAGTETADGWRFEGSGQGFVSEPFALPEGTVIISAAIPGEGDDSPYAVELVPAPGSAGEVALDWTFGRGPYDGAATRQVTAAGEFVLEIHARGTWSATVEF